MPISGTEKLQKKIRYYYEVKLTTVYKKLSGTLHNMKNYYYIYNF